MRPSVSGPYWSANPQVWFVDKVGGRRRRDRAAWPVTSDAVRRMSRTPAEKETMSRTASCLPGYTRSPVASEDAGRGIIIRTVSGRERKPEEEGAPWIRDQGAPGPKQSRYSLGASLSLLSRRAPQEHIAQTRKKGGGRVAGCVAILRLYRYTGKTHMRCPAKGQLPLRRYRMTERSVVLPARITRHITANINPP